MHPDDTSGFSDIAITQPTPAPLHQTTQHGFPVPTSTDPSLCVGSREVGVSGAIGDAGSGEEYPVRAARLSATEGSPAVEVPRGDTGSESPSKRDAIRNYEAMGTSPTRDTAFRVKKTNWDGRKDSPISRFPNEVLIHALSFLDPHSLLTAALISWRFHSLVTSSHAWRSAFSRYFPSSLAISSSPDARESAAFSSSQDRRYFTRLSGPEKNGNAWRKEYILRTRLLRNLAKGRTNISTNVTTPISHNSHGSVVITYPAATGSWSVSHIAANFAPRGVRLLHASVHTPGAVSASDPTIGKVERPPLADAFTRVQQRPDLHQPLLGLHGFEVAMDMGTSGVMDLSEDIGWIYGENVAGGKVYVHPYPSPYIASATQGIYIHPDLESIDGLHPVVTSVWIAKNRSTGVLETTGGRVGVVVGNSRGVVSTYGLRFGKENKLTHTKKFCVSPGIPIVSIKVDDDYSVKRMRQKNAWIVIINALGEIYYLRNSRGPWKIIPQTARTATTLYNSTFPQPAGVLGEDEQAGWEKSRDEKLMKMDYEQVKELWEEWGMDWFVEVDWADQNVVVGTRQSIEKRPRPQDDAVRTNLYKYHLVLRGQGVGGKSEFVRELVMNPTEEPTFTDNEVEGSVFGGVTQDPTRTIAKDMDMNETPMLTSTDEATDVWIATHFQFGEKNLHIITTTAIDNSSLALLSDREDLETETEVPGGNARLFAVGTHMGSIFVWNIRSPGSSTVPDAMETHHPLRIIHTDSPQISTLALSSLYLVHGGTDGLVQAWDPLGSTLLPIRNIHSRFSTRARRRIAQADAGAQEEFGVGDNQFAARCLIVDSDPTSLRGAVALGTHIRYWCFSTSTEPEKKRRKPGPRSRASGTPSRGRGAIKEVIASESKYLLRQKEQERKEKEELKKRYGIASGREALSEEEMVEYATMISREAFELESGASFEGSEESVNRSRTVTPDGAPSVSSYGTADEYKSPDEGVNDEHVDPDLAEALRLSLLESGSDDGKKLDQREEVWEDADYLYSDFGSTQYHSPPRYATASSSSASRPKSRSPTNYYDSPPSPSVQSSSWEGLQLDQTDEWPSVGKGKGKVKNSDREEDEFETDLEMAIRLSLIEEEERRVIMAALDEDEGGKGKGKA